MAQAVQFQNVARLEVSGTASSNGDNTIIAAPGTTGGRIVITDVVLQNESSTPTTMILKDGVGGTVKLRCLAQNQGDGIAMVYAPDSRPKLTANTLLDLNLSGANSCGYTIGYYLG